MASRNSPERQGPHATAAARQRQTGDPASMTMPGDRPTHDAATQSGRGPAPAHLTITTL